MAENFYFYSDFSKPLRLLYSLIIYEFSFFALYSLLLLSFFLYLKSVPIHVIVHVHACPCASPCPWCVHVQSCDDYLPCSPPI